MRKVITVSYGKVPTSYRWRCYGPAIYQESIRKRDGVKIWRYEGHYGKHRSTVKLAVEDAKKYAAELGIEYLDDVRHNQLVEGVASAK